MPNKTKILIVEDDMIIAANISLQLTNLGYQVTALISSANDALLQFQNNKPEIAIIDINLKGKLDGIDLVTKMQETQNIPIIYLTANTDEAHFNRAKSTNPFAFISKPYKNLDLQHAIELTLNRIKANKSEIKLETTEKITPFILSDSIFVKHLEKMVRVNIEDILYIEAERNYCRIHSKTKEYLLVMTLKDLDEKLPNRHFIRVHRSFIVNLSQIVEIATSYIVIAKKAIPVSKALKEELLNRLQTI
ncbi:transcriptional regulator [Tamlana sedimentorum]|uniref:Transcriptional regulator n=1 Tax=Neotamlana sedimentorum TaxID=1435349 RepID=A0A0D7W7G7_9FLAO|nr:LytTR family transcriptional regulator DNA-binding domain-containing protein [Tamlana sedimentorum]KJD34959.1 transcriptional regulator [Tamlana sedimentorum]